MTSSPQQIDPGSAGTDVTVPDHVAVIMDGNGRWARARGMPRVEGHRRGADSVRAVIKAAARSGVRYLTLFGFSSENWKRPDEEVGELMGLLRIYLRKELASLHKQGVRFRMIGDRSRLPADIQELIQGAEAHTKDNVGLTLVVALSYGGRAEIVNAARRIAQRVKAGDLDPADINDAEFGRYLETADIPDPDLLIRTSGEQRLSNFLLWQCAYTEFVFVDTLWPDFGEDHFLRALSEYHGRERRFGAVGG